MKKKKLSKKEITERASKIKLLLLDVDGVMTDTGVYYSSGGEEFKRFSIRDGMGIERLRRIADVETGIVTREDTKIVSSRARKLKITELHLGVMKKEEILEEILKRKNLRTEQVAFMGDDTNDVEIMKLVGLSACPNDATEFAREVADLIVKNKGGNGAVRDFAELIIEAKLITNRRKN